MHQIEVPLKAQTQDTQFARVPFTALSVAGLCRVSVVPSPATSGRSMEPIAHRTNMNTQYQLAPCCLAQVLTHGGTMHCKACGRTSAFHRASMLTTVAACSSSCAFNYSTEVRTTATWSGLRGKRVPRTAPVHSGTGNL